MEYLKKNIGGIILIAIIVTIATCVSRMNSSYRAGIIENPEPGNYFVFRDFPQGTEEAIMKVKEVKEKEILFYLPHGGIMFGFTPNESESTVIEADKEGKMYGTETIAILKTSIQEMNENDSFSGMRNDEPRITFVFK